jgi:hypothetical protein
MKNLLCFVFIFILCACQTKQTVLFSPKQHQYQAQRHASLHQESALGNAAPFVRQPEVVKVYGVNRYVDPGDSRVMHERHAIYRLEQQPGWTTRSPRSQNEVILGPIVGLRKPEYAPEPLPGETIRELAEMKRSALQSSQDFGMMREGQSKLASGVETLAKQTAEAQQKLTSVISVLNQRLDRLENAGSKDNQPAANAADIQDSEVVIHTPNQ